MSTKKPHIPYGTVSYGFKAPILEADHFHLGSERSLPKIVLRPDARWSPFAPEYEAQADVFETQGCTVWGTQNAVETLDRAAFGEKTNYAERFTYIDAGVSPDSGGDPHRVAESIRTEGLVAQELLPMTGTLEEFVQPNPLTADLKAEAAKWLKRKSFGHEWVFTGDVPQETRTALMRETLRYSPLCASVSAWTLGPDGTYIDAGLPNNHWVEILEEVATGWLIFDSYDTSLKVVSFDHQIGFCKRYALSAAVQQEMAKRSIFSIFKCKKT